MTNSNAQAQRRWRERQKQKRQEELKLPDAPRNTSPFRRPFCEALQEDANGSNIDISLDYTGIEPVYFADDSGPRSFSGEVERAAAELGEDAYRGANDSLGRAEVMVGSLIEAAAELASIINTYKRKEIQQRIAEIEMSDLTDPAVRKVALAQIVRLNKLLEQLGKQIRWSFKQWKTDET